MPFFMRVPTPAYLLLDIPHILKPPPKPSVVGMERDLPGVTVLAMPQDAVTRHPPLESSKDDAAQF
jgi:hypothetical protein